MDAMPTASGAPALDAPLARGMRARVAWRLLRMLGWRVTLATPVPMKCVIVFYPHTSNWDFPAGLLAIPSYPRIFDTSSHQVVGGPKQWLGFSEPIVC